MKHSFFLASLCLALVACSNISHVAPDGWKTYTHTRYDYQIDYPADAIIEESEGGTYSIEGMAKDVPFPDATCVTVHEAFGAVTVSGPDDPLNENDSDTIYCGLIDIQTGGGQPESKEFTVEGKSVTAEGYFNPAGIGMDLKPIMQTEWLTFVTPGGFRVVYRLDPQSDADLARYEEVKAKLETIAQSIRAK